MRLHLIPGAVLRVLVRPEPEEARPVAEPFLLHLVETNLAHDLGTHLVPGEVAALGPARAALRRAAPFARGLELALFTQRREHALELLLERPGDPRGVADEVERPVRAVEAQEQRCDAVPVRAV